MWSAPGFADGSIFLSQVKFTRFLAAARKKLWWMTPEWGTQSDDLPPETQFLLLELEESGPYAILLPLIDSNTFRGTLRPPRCSFGISQKAFFQGSFSRFTPQYQTAYRSGKSAGWPYANQWWCTSICSSAAGVLLEVLHCQVGCECGDGLEAHDERVHLLLEPFGHVLAGQQLHAGALWLQREQQLRALVTVLRHRNMCAVSFIFAVVDMGLERGRIRMPGSMRKLAWGVSTNVVADVPAPAAVVALDAMSTRYPNRKKQASRKFTICRLNTSLRRASRFSASASCGDGEGYC